MWRKFGLMMVGLSSLWVMAGTPVQAKVQLIKQHSSALSQPHGLRSLANRRVTYVRVPKSYAHASAPHGINTIRSIKGTASVFKTQYLLPDPGPHAQAWGNPQGMALAGRYLYVTYCPTKQRNRGRLVRFDMSRLAALHIKTPAAIQKTFWGAYRGTAQTQAIQKAIKWGPLFTTGHGQSLAYNPKNHQLFMWQDREKKPRVPATKYGYIQRLNQHTLRPDRLIRFKMRSRTLNMVCGHVLTFDRYGNAYFWTRPTAHTVRIFKGRITSRSVHFHLTRQILQHGPGTRVQNMGYNPKNGRLYLVSDSSVASFPAKRLNGRGSLTNRSFKWTRFAPKREFEALTFDAHGRGYLMSNHWPEILRETSTHL